MTTIRSPGRKLGVTILVAVLLAIPLLAIYALVYDRQDQSETARASVAQGWGGEQLLAGPVLVIPFTETSTETVTEDGRPRTRTIESRQLLYLSPTRQTLKTAIDPERRQISIYQSVVYRAVNQGTARFTIPDDLNRYGVDRTKLDFSRAELRFGVSDARGLQPDARISANGQKLAAEPGKGLLATGGSGFFAFVDWQGAGALNVSYSYSLNGSGGLSFVPRGKESEWSITSPWPHPSFAGNFLPATHDINDDGFTARYAISNLALGQAMAGRDDFSAPDTASGARRGGTGMSGTPVAAGATQAASINLVEPVDLYSQVNRAVKYGFLFIGFTFLAFLMFDLVGGATVAAAEYLLVGSGLILFFVLLLAFAEVIGFALAYLVAGGAITGLLTAYSAAVLGSWKRAQMIAALLAGLYAVLYVLLSLEALSLLIGSVLLFVALAAVMWATRRIDWSGLRTQQESVAE